MTFLSEFVECFRGQSGSWKLWNLRQNGSLVGFSCSSRHAIFNPAVLWNSTHNVFIETMAKRTNLASIACKRCITKKRRCDGDVSTKAPCRNCVNSKSRCEYDARRSPAYALSLEEEIKSLQAKIQELEQKKSLGHFAADPGVEEPTGNGESTDFRLILRRNFLLEAPSAGVSGENDGIPSKSTRITPDHLLRPQLEQLVQNDESIDLCYEHYFSGIHGRYPFLNKRYMNNLHLARKRVLSKSDAHGFKLSQNDQFDKFLLLMVYAIGSRTMTDSEKSIGEEYQHEAFFESAMILRFDFLDQSRNLTYIHACLLCLIYELPITNVTAIWYFAGSVLRLCVNLDLHSSNANILRDDPVAYLARSKTFWTAYCLERLVSTTFFRPFALSDTDIALNLPVDVDEDTENPNSIKSAFYRAYPHLRQENYAISVATTPNRTSISLSIIYVQFRVNESKIRTTIYRKDKRYDFVPHKEIQLLLDRIEHWRESFPGFLSLEELSYWSYMYHKQVRYLIQPFLGMLSANEPLFARCIASCQSICEFSKRMLEKSGKITFLSLDNIFLSGMNLLYGLLSKKCTWDMALSEALRDCTAFLAKISMQTKECERYNEIFKKLLRQALEQKDDIMGDVDNTMFDKFAAQLGKTTIMNTEISMQPVDLLFGQSADPKPNNFNQISNFTGMSIFTQPPEAPFYDVDTLFSIDPFQDLGDLSSFPTDWSFGL